MLHIKVPAREFYDESSATFINRPEVELELEHSLISLSRWESKWKKPFLGESERSIPEMQDYIRCMTINQKAIPEEVFGMLDLSIINEVQKYIDDPQTATTITTLEQPRIYRKQKITSELLYSWMIMNDIPFQCEKWHLNRLLMLIRVCGIQNAPTKKMMSKHDIFAQNRALNAKRRKALHSRG